MSLITSKINDGKITFWLSGNNYVNIVGLCLTVDWGIIEWLLPKQNSDPMW